MFDKVKEPDTKQTQDFSMFLFCLFVCLFGFCLFMCFCGFVLFLDCFL